MKPGKYGVVLDKGSGPLRAIVPQLERLNFQAIFVPEAEAALAFAKVYPKLSSIAVNGAVVSNPAAFAQELQKPNVPLIWLGPGGEALASDAPEVSARRRILTSPPSPEDLIRMTEELVLAHLYPQEIQEALVTATELSLSGFQVQASLRSPFLRASHTQLAELCAVLSFAGPGIAGHLLVGSSPAAAHATAPTVYSIRDEDVTDEHQADVVGEICNTILGRVLRYFEDRDLAMRFGVPVLFRGTEGEVRSQPPAPSLCLECEGERGSFFIELSFSQLDEPTRLLTSPAPQELLGDCLFF